MLFGFVGYNVQCNDKEYGCGTSETSCHHKIKYIHRWMSEQVANYLLNKLKMDDEKAEAVKCAGLEFSYWAAMSVGSFLTVFLQGIGFTASQVGIINSLNSAVGIVSGPIWGMLSDKMQSIKRTMMICIFGAMILQVFIPASTTITVVGISLITLYMPIVTFFVGPSMVLLDSWVIQSSHKNGFTYSTVRSTGSLSWAVAGVIVSFILSKSQGGIRNTFYIASFMMIPLLLLAFFTKNATGDGDTAKRTLSFKEMQLGALFKDYYFTAYLIYTFILSIAFMTGFAFLSYLIKDVGGSITNVGYVQGMNAMIQFIVLLAIKPLIRRFPLYKILIIGNLLTGLQYFFFGTITQSFTHMLLFASLNGLGSGLMIASGANYVYSLAPKHLKATAQTVCAAAASIAGIFGNMLGGILIDSLGVRKFYLIVAFWIVASVALFGLSFIFGKRVLKLKVPVL